MLVDEALIRKDLTGIEKKFLADSSSIRTGRPSLQIFENIFVDYYGARTAISYMGSPTIVGMSVTMKVFDKSATTLVVDALKMADIGATVNQSDPTTININFIPMTGEIRNQKVKELYDMLEDARIQVRQNVRRKYMEEISSLEKVSEDEQKRSELRVQELVDEAIEKLEKIAEDKEIEIKSV